MKHIKDSYNDSVIFVTDIGELICVYPVIVHALLFYKGMKKCINKAQFILFP